MRTKSITTLALLALAAAAGAAHATEYRWDWSATPGATNNAGGAFESIHSTFDTSTNQLVWNVTFSNQITDGYTLALNDGPNPKGHAGELALLYFDFSRGTPKLTAYAYNGANLNNSWRDGNAAVSGDQTGDVIHRVNDTSWYSASVVDTSDGRRTFYLTMDASTINSHTPMYPGPEGPGEWYGMGFGEQLGLWMHTYASLSSGYLSNGRLCGWQTSGEGWFDGAGFQTVLVPLPPAAWAGLGGLAIAGFSARRRQKALRKQA